MSTMSSAVKLWSDSSARSYLKAKKSKALQLLVKVERSSGQ